MESFQKLFPSKYVKAADLDGEEQQVTIDRLAVEWIGSGNDAEEKPVFYFTDHDQSLVLNKTNATTIAQLHGEDTDDWCGKSIVLYPTTVQYGAKTVDCVRVKHQPRQPQEGEVVTVPEEDSDDSNLPF